MATPFPDVTIGGYLPLDSVLHRLDPRTKIICAVVAIIFIFTADRVGEIALLTALTLLAAFLSRVGARLWLWGIRRFSFLLLFGILMHLLFNPAGRYMYIGDWLLPFTEEAAINALLFGWRIAAATVISMTLTFTTAPKDLASALHKSARPLARIGLSGRETGFILLLAMRFIPILQREVAGIREAQEARGVQFATGRYVNRAVNLSAILTPALAAALRRAESLATAMACRGFEPGKDRTEFQVFAFGRIDAVALVAMACLPILRLWCFLAG